jgi:hypothetical protein
MGNQLCNGEGTKADIGLTPPNNATNNTGKLTATTTATKLILTPLAGLSLSSRSAP